QNQCHRPMKSRSTPRHSNVPLSANLTKALEQSVAGREPAKAGGRAAAGAQPGLERDLLPERLRALPDVTCRCGLGAKPLGGGAEGSRWWGARKGGAQSTAA